MRERVISFRGEDHTIVVHDGDGNWSLYRGADCNEVTDLSPKEVDELNDYVYDWRAGD